MPVAEPVVPEVQLAEQPEAQLVEQPEPEQQEMAVLTSEMQLHLQHSLLTW
jgi:hypothetical protein